MSCKLPICYIIICFISLTLSAQNVIYVAPNGVSDGSTWAKASNIKDAIAYADSGDELWLRQGTYIITETLEVDFSLKLYGGYSGVGNNRDPENYQSILNGGNKVSVLDVTSRASEVLLDGLYFENGLARSESEIEDLSEGGGLSLRGDGSVILNCVFRNNNSRNSMGSGAIYIWADDVLVENCIFENNSVLENYAEYGNIGGGAIHIRFGANNVIKACEFKNNSSYYEGGAIHSFADNAHILDCVFEGNYSHNRGGAIFLNNNSLTVSNSVIKNNRSAINGGGLFANFGELTLENVRFENNEAEEYGGGLYNNFGTIKITNSLFFKNQAVAGGGIYNAEDIELSNVNFISNEHTALYTTPHL
ncbi:right-handed parallel beta-helix repeat-containing protein [Galbibacter sp.]|uniref:right-handed parallel beta-helix repeat-containing protein n=1 Tax=Galbibacter sp. TaxID=2918471 RepID=UPI003A91192F